MPEEAKFSLDPDGAVHGSPVPNNFNGEVVAARFIHGYQYGTAVGVGLLVTVVRREPGQPPEELERPPFYSAGKLDDWAVSDDGGELIPLKGQPNLKDNCNLHKFLSAVKTLGITIAGGRIPGIVGLYAFWQRVDAERDMTGTNRDPKRPDTVLVPVKVLPGSKVGRVSTLVGTNVQQQQQQQAPAPTAVAPIGATPAVATDDSTMQQIADFLMAQVVAGPKSKGNIMKEAPAFAQANKIPLTRIAAALKDDKGLGGLGLKVNGNEISLSV